MQHPNKKQREKMKSAVAYMKEFMNSYDTQAGYETYSEETFIDDVLYGLGVSLDKKNQWAGGYRIFKERLRKHLAV